MRKLLIALLCFLLCGCAQQPAAAEETHSSAAKTILSSEGLTTNLQIKWDLESQYNGALQACPLSVRKVQGMRNMGENLLLFSGNGSTTLTLLSGDDLTEITSVTLDLTLDPHDPSLQITEAGLSFFDPEKKETVKLNSALEETGRIAAPADVSGSPILSSDGTMLYYGTPNAIREWNLETGIRRRIKELPFQEVALSGLHWNDQVLQCRITENNQLRTLFLDADSGALLQEKNGEIQLTTLDERYYAFFPMGYMYGMVFGENASAPQALFPDDLSASCIFLPRLQAAVTLSERSDALLLEYYALDTGLRHGALSLQEFHAPKDIVSNGDDVHLLIYDPEHDCDVIFRWDIPKPTHTAKNASGYTDSYHTAAAPDLAGLTVCQRYAEEIGSKYGINILIWKDAIETQPWDYVFEEAYLCQVILEELTLLDQRLAQYPQGLLAETASHFSSLNFCLVQQITGSPASGSLDTATGIQFLRGTDAYVVLAAGKYSEQALYHELFHVMETHILTQSIALDRWNDLNPAGFEYDYDYQANARRNSGIYLQKEYRAFVDTYSMSYPKEDRARVMEYAMLPGNEELFRPEIMQAKLKALCLGIREAYGLEKSPEHFLWEQYLEKPLAYPP